MDEQTYRGSSTKSFEEAALHALPPQQGDAPETFDIALSVERGGIVGVQFHAALTRRG